VNPSVYNKQFEEFIMKNYLLIGAAAVSLAACGTTPTEVVGTQTTTFVSESNIPEWYVNTPSAEGTIFSSGTAVSGDLQLAKDIAVLNAKHVLADRINGKLKAETRSFINEVNLSADDTVVIRDIERVAINTVDNIDVAGYTVSDTVLLIDNGRYRAYVLLDYSDVEVNKILLNRLRQSTKAQATEAYERLEKKVEEEVKTEESGV
jgi:starvation-inducible outer membrane lipoprotein